MIEEKRKPPAEGDSKPPKPPSIQGGQRAFLLSVAGLLTGVMALGLASIPPLAFHNSVVREAPAYSADEVALEETTPPASAPEPEETEGGITLKFKKFSIKFGGNDSEDKPPPESEPEPEPEAKPRPVPIARPVPAAQPGLQVTEDPLRWFTISAVGCALAGLVIAGIGQIRERHTAVTVCAMGCCVAAITWQYVAAGITIGVAAVVFVLLLLFIGSLISS